jgi:hypothetical protein
MAQSLTSQSSAVRSSTDEVANQLSGLQSAKSLSLAPVAEPAHTVETQAVAPASADDQSVRQSVSVRATITASPVTQTLSVQTLAAAPTEASPSDQTTSSQSGMSQTPGTTPSTAPQPQNTQPAPMQFSTMSVPIGQVNVSLASPQETAVTTAPASTTQNVSPQALAAPVPAPSVPAPVPQQVVPTPCFGQGCAAHQFSGQRPSTQVFLGTQPVLLQLPGSGTSLQQSSAPATPPDQFTGQQSLPVQFPDAPSAVQPVGIQPDDSVPLDDFDDERNPVLLGRCRTAANLCYFSTEQKINVGGRCFCNTSGGRIPGTVE